MPVLASQPQDHGHDKLIDLPRVIRPTLTKPPPRIVLYRAVRDPKTLHAKYRWSRALAPLGQTGTRVLRPLV